MQPLPVQLPALAAKLAFVTLSVQVCPDGPKISTTISVVTLLVIEQVAEDQLPCAFARAMLTSPVVAPATFVADAGVQVCPEVEEPITKRPMLCVPPDMVRAE